MHASLVLYADELVSIVRVVFEENVFICYRVYNLRCFLQLQGHLTASLATFLLIFLYCYSFVSINTLEGSECLRPLTSCCCS